MRAVTAVALGIALVGCGGEGDLSRAEYVSALNTICEDYRARHARIGEPLTVDDVAKKGPQIAAAFEVALERERKLEPPGELAADAHRFHELGEEQLEVLNGLARAAQAGDRTTVLELAARNDELNREANALARRLGATACAE